ncbi:MAG: baseplate J/gp47 family protein, partial [Bdellovibrionales bacterium]
VMVLGSAVDGVESSGSVTSVITGGADTETDDALFSRMLLAYQETAHGGAKNDYKRWALAVAGVTRAWDNPNGFGIGTVVVYIMFDDANADYDGFPQGTDGVAANEPRGIAATGDQLAVADYIFGDDRQPVTALVHVVSPIAFPVDFTITGLTAISDAKRAEISQAIKDVFREHADPKGGTVELSYIEVAIAAISGTTPFVITSPMANITPELGYLPTLGEITYA